LIEKVKIFKLTDEPSAADITEDEYRKIQMEILKNPNYKFVEDMRSREVNMEKENMNKAKERGKLALEKLAKMVPQTAWRIPFGNFFIFIFIN
jgi:hypothetical protein